MTLHDMNLKELNAVTGLSNEKPEIRLDGGRLPEVLDEIELALLDTKVEVFIYGGRLVEPTPVTPDPRGGVQRATGAVVLSPVDAHRLRELVTRVANVMRFDGRSNDYRSVDLPRSYAEAFLSRGSWQLRLLTGVIEAPTICKGGKVLDEIGYDSSTGIFLSGSLPSDYKRPEAQASKDQAALELDHLLSLLETFPFSNLHDLSSAVASILTVLVRRQIPSAPLIGITATSPGTGKSLLGDVLSIIATGRRAAVLGLGDDQAEGDKRLSGILLAGDPVIVLDNVERPLIGDLLCQMLTQPAISVRPLGSSTLCRVPTNCTLIATGNNLDVRGDLRRRVMLIQMDARTERPELRQFDRNPLDYTNEHRGRLISAALTLPLAYRAAGCPVIDGAHPYGGFDEWNKLCRLPLMWLGLPDPLGSSESLRDTDPDLANTRQLYSAWWERYGQRALTAAEVISGADGDLREALLVVCYENNASRRLGNWLRKHRGRIIDGLVLSDAGRDTHRKVPRWSINKCE